MRPFTANKAWQYHDGFMINRSRIPNLALFRHTCTTAEKEYMDATRVIVLCTVHCKTYILHCWQTDHWIYSLDKGKKKNSKEPAETT